jgi:hypothetical protein
MGKLVFGLSGLVDLAVDNIPNYSRDCDSIKRTLMKQQLALAGIVEAIRDKSDDAGKAELIASQQELRLAKQDYDKAVKEYQRDCGKAKRSGIW